MAKKIRKTMTDAQLTAAVENFNSHYHIPKLRGGKASVVHQDNKYSRRTRREGKQINETTY